MTYTIVDPAGHELAGTDSAAAAKRSLHVCRQVHERLTVLRLGVIVTEGELDTLCQAEARGEI